MSVRGIRSISLSQPTLEGAGVHLRRGFGFGNTSEFDPFLLFDDFRGECPSDYQAGFPWHPHRGIETITYVLAGSVEHRDSLGNRGVMKSGDIQWMTAGRGILHQEMPEGDTQGRMHGFQLWANLPARLKMTAPRYQDIPAAAIPEIVDDDGTRVRVMAGSFWGKTGPVEGIAADPNYLDIFIPAGVTKRIPVSVDRHAFAYVFEGRGNFHAASAPQGVLTEDLATDIVTRAYPAENRHLILFDQGDEIVVSVPRGDDLRGGSSRGGSSRGETAGLRFLLATGSPLGEPVAWHGPIVMNTQAEIRQAVRELNEGTFITR